MIDVFMEVDFVEGIVSIDESSFGDGGFESLLKCGEKILFVIIIIEKYLS